MRRARRAPLGGDVSQESYGRGQHITVQTILEQGALWLS